MHEEPRGDDGSRLHGSSGVGIDLDMYPRGTPVNAER